MASGHAHGHFAPSAAGDPLAGRRAANSRRMWIALAINAAMVVAGIVGGILTDSLAVLADAGHVLSDAGAIALALFAARLASRAGGPRRTFGYQRGEVIAALVNGLALVAIAAVVAVAAIDRLGDPPDVAGGGVVALGMLELAGNVAAAWVLARGDRVDVNLEAVLRHSAVDALGSLAVVVSGVLVLATGWTAADPIAGLAIAVLIVASSVRLIREPFDVLMEAAPADVDVDRLGRAMCEVRGVVQVHELHVWTVTSGFEALAAHVVVASGDDRDRARRELEYLLRERFGIAHTTLQMEEGADESALLQVQSPLQQP
jgi:cobalt-zinc-cadmium efflux system protein